MDDNNERCRQYVISRLTPAQLRAMGPEGEKSLWDYWHGKMLFWGLMAFLAAYALAVLLWPAAFGVD